MALLAESHEIQMTLGALAAATLPGLPMRFMEWPGIFAALFHGDLLYQRFTGEIIWPTPQFAPAFLALTPLTIVGPLSRRTGPNLGLLKRLSAGFALFTLLTLVIAPGNSDRYFLLVLYFGVFFFAVLFRLLFLFGASKAVGTVVLVILLLFNVSRTAMNFYAAHLTSGGKTSTFLIGSQGETSNGFVSIDSLYRHLAREDVKDIYAEFFIILPLQFYDLERHRFRRLGLIDTTSRLPDDVDYSSSFVVSYDGGYNRISPEDFGVHELWTFQHFAISAFPPRQAGTSPGARPSQADQRGYGAWGATSQSGRSDRT
jgi:hypothetical protein